MTVDTEVPRTRRALLNGAIVAGVATVAAAVVRPLPAEATNGGSVILGSAAVAPLDGTGTNEATSPTRIYSSAGDAFEGHSGAAGTTGLTGRSSAATGSGNGVYGRTAATGGIGVFGEATALTGNTMGVFGFAVSTTGIGVSGFGTSIGVAGTSPVGTGVRAGSDSGLALDVAGRVKFSRSGKASVAANATYVDVTVPGGLPANSVVHATIQTHRTGVAVAAARPNWPTAGKIRIYLTKIGSTTSSTPVAWFVAEY